MSEKERLNEPAMRDMEKSFKQAAEQLGQTKEAMKKIVQTMQGSGQDGALLGAGGDIMHQAIGTTMIKKLDKLQAKMTELASDIDKAVNRMRAAEGQAAKPFGS